MTADVVLTLGLEAGPAEAGARVIRRALDQVGAAATSASGTVQGLRRTLEAISADRAVGELKRLEAATRAAGVTQTGLGRAAAQSLGASLDLGRRLSTYVRDQVRDHDALRDVLRRTREDLAGSKRNADDLGRSVAGIAQTLVSSFTRGRSAAGGFEQTLQRLTPQVLRLILPSAGGQAGRGAMTGFNPMMLFGGSDRSGGRGGLPSLGGIGGNASQWLANTFPSVFASNAGAMAATSVAAESLLPVALAPNLLATALPMVAAIALPMILGGLFSKKPSVGPNANATVGALSAGELGIVDRGADNGGSVEAAVELAETAIKALAKTLRQIGATLADVNSVAGLQVGYFKGKFFVDDTRLGGTASYERNQFENAEAAVADFVRRALNNADLSGIGETMRTALANTKARSFEDLGRHIDFARDYDRDFEPMETAAAQIEALTRRFDDLRDTAIELGLDIAKVEQAFARERQKLAQEFDREISGALLARSVVGFRKLAEDAKTRLEQARVLGADLGAVERQNFYEKRALLLRLGEEERKVFLGLLDVAERAAFAVTEGLAKMGTEAQKLEGALGAAVAASRQAAGSYRQLGESLRDTAGAIRLSDLSLLSSADKFAEVRRQFDDAKRDAATGDQDAARRLGSLARSTLEMGRQFYGASPEYSALYQEVVGTLGDTATIQDGIALRLDAHTVLLDAQLQVLKEIDKRLAKGEEATGALDYLDLTLTRQGALGAFDQVVARGEIERLKELSAGMPSEARDILKRISDRLGDNATSEAEAALNQTDVERLRLLFFEELQRQVGKDSDAVQAFDLLNEAIKESGKSSASLATRLRSLGEVFQGLKDIFGGAQSPLVDPAALQALLGNVAGLVKDLSITIPGDASGVIGAIQTLVGGLPKVLSDTSRLDLGVVASGLGGIANAIDALIRSPGMIRLPGDLVEQESAFRSLGDYLDRAGLAPSIDAIVGSLDALGSDSGALGSLRVALASLAAPTVAMADAIKTFETAIADLLKTLGAGNTIDGRRMPEIDRSALTGGSVAQFDMLAGRVGAYIGGGTQAGFSEAQLKGAASWTWAVTERDRIIRSLTTIGDAEALLDRYYGGQRRIVANADDQGANNLVQRIADLGGGAVARETLGPLVRRFLSENRVGLPEGESYIAAPDAAEARALIDQAADHVVPWRDRYQSWWNAGRDVTRLDEFARGGVVTAPTLFGYGDRLGLMGEAGAEAILPLRRGRDGRLGVAANGNAPDPALLADLVAEVRALRLEVADLRRQQAGEHREAIGQGALFAQRLAGRRAAGGRG